MDIPGVKCRIPDRSGGGDPWNLARSVRRAGLTGLLFSVLAILSVVPVQAGMATAPVSAVFASTGNIDDIGPETLPIFRLPRAGLENTAALPSDDELAAERAVIGKIVIRNENIFDLSDPRENNWLFRLANTLHPKTRPWLIRNQLLFRPGDAYDRRILDESERILRSNRYFYDARIRPIAYYEGRVDVEVTTHDVWTLRPGLSFGRQGGANTTSIDLSEKNLGGTGIGIGIAHSSTPDRDTDTVFIDSTHLGGTWFRTELLFAENSDGRRRKALVERPFYALDTRWAAGASFEDDLRVDSIFGRVGVAGRFQTHARTSTAWGGWSGGRKSRWVKRYTIGFNRDESRFAPAPEAVPIAPVPPDRILAYPWAGFELVEDSFEKAINRDQIGRTEDFYLGTRLRASLGYSSDLFGADREAIVFNGQFGTGTQSAGSVTMLVDSTANGRFESGSVRDTTLGANGRLYVRLSETWLFFTLLSGKRGVNLDPDHELVIGGENGLRGYPRRYQWGDRVALLTLEGRYYTSLYPFRLARIGGALFYDVGRAWGGDFAKAPDSGILQDVGAGIRIGLTRSGLGNVVHIDVAFPLGGDPTISRVQFLVTTKESF